MAARETYCPCCGNLCGCDCERTTAELAQLRQFHEDICEMLGLSPRTRDTDPSVFAERVREEFRSLKAQVQYGE